MRKILLLVLILMLISVAACKQAAEETEKKIEAPTAETTGEAVVDAVGNDLNAVNDVEKDLGTEELGDLDSGLDDIQNI